MATDSDIDEALDEYDYSKKPSKVWLISLAVLLLIALAGAAGLGKLWSDARSEQLQAEQSIAKIGESLSLMETQNAELSTLVSEKQAEIERLQTEWTRQVAELEKDHKEQLTRTFAQMNEIVYDSEKTLKYINDIETRMRDGQKVDRQEAQKLASVVNGLTFLREQYKKPISEFREVDRYFKKQLQSISSSSDTGVPLASVVAVRPDPASTTRPLARLFNNRRFRANREAYLQEKGRAQGVAEGQVTGRREGKRQALTEAQQVVQQAYARAQKQMSEIAIDYNDYLVQLDALADSNNQSVADVESFFQQSRKILKIHNEIMSVEPVRPNSIRP